jgi:Predicted O-linked N-acetylglucosamine transferase, SPINDLY family
MGIPILTLAGNRYASRIGQRLNHALNLPEWIAKEFNRFLV